jgi:hypothetical protein
VNASWTICAGVGEFLLIHASARCPKLRATRRAERLGQHPIDTLPGDAEGLCDVRGPHAGCFHFPHPCGLYRRWAALVDAGGLRLGNALELRSRRRFVSNSANMLSMSRKHLTAVPVSIGYSVILSEAPRRRSTVTKRVAAIGSLRRLDAGSKGAG